MNRKIKIILILIGLFIFQSVIFAQTPDFSGTWILNLEKSQLESKPEGMTGSIFIIKQDGNKFSLTRYHIIGEKKKKISFTMLADGKTRKIKVLFKGKLEWKGNDLQASIWRKNFSNIVTYKIGNTPYEFIADEVFTSNPKSHHNIWVFDREVPNN